MAVAEIIGAAIGVLLLVVVAYLLVGGTLNAAETMGTAQKDLTLINEARLRTSIEISDTEMVDPNLNLNITNNGNEAVTDLPHMDVFSYNTTNGYTHYIYDNSGSAGTWSITGFQNDIIHRGQLDPGVSVKIRMVFPAEYRPESVQVTTSNGISAVASI